MNALKISKSKDVKFDRKYEIVGLVITRLELKSVGEGFEAR